MSDYFVDPKEIRLPLADGQYLIVKAELTAGEDLDMVAAMRSDDGERIDPVKWGPALITAYLLDWSIEDAAGRIVSVRERPAAEVIAALRQLRRARYKAILEAIEAHDAQAKAADEVKKTTPTIAAESARTWPSPVAAAGGTNG